MGTRMNLFKNTIALSVPNALNPLVSFALVLVISRYLGVVGLGEYSLLLSYCAVFTTSATLGLNALVVREVSRRPDRSHIFFLNSSAFGVVSSLISMIAMYITVVVMKYPENLILASIPACLSLLPSTGIRYVESVFRAAEKSEYMATCYVVENTFRVMSCAAVVLLGYGMFAVMTAITFTRFGAYLMMLYFYFKIIGFPKWTFSQEVWKLLIKQAPTFTSIAIFSTLHLSMPNIMLSKLQSIEGVGIYSAAGKITAFLDIIPLGFSMALLPVLTKKYSSGLEDLKRVSTDSLRYAFMFVFPMVAGTFILADQMISLVYGQKFADAGIILQFQSIGTIPYCVLISMAQLLVATDNQKIDLYINMVAVALNFSLNYFLIPKFGGMGAVTGTVMTYAILNQLQYAYIRKHLFPINFFRISARFLLATLGMSAATYMLRESNLILNIVVSALLYFLLAVALRAFTEEELDSIKNLVSKFISRRRN
jgi:O-antigen/teichoic acid export membrane protein